MIENAQIVLWAALGFAAALFLWSGSMALLRRWRAKQHYRRYRENVLRHGWFDPEINPSAVRHP